MGLRISIENRIGMVQQGANSKPPAILNDGNTVAWYDYKDTNSVVKDAGGFISMWKDKLGSGRDLVQNIGSFQPLATLTGVLFDGIDNYLKTASFQFVQPEFIYLVFRQIIWRNGYAIMDGDTDDSGELAQSGVSAKIVAYAGNYSSSVNFPLNEFGIIRVLFNNNIGKMIVNNEVPITVIGTKNMNGITFARYGNTAMFSKIEIKEVICRKVSDSNVNETAIYDYLKSKYSL